jgi:hypothetical protein
MYTRVVKTRIALLGLALAALPLSGCVTDDGYGVGWSSYPYSGWYDGAYGPIYDGYWGLDGLFYYRSGPGDRSYRRDDRQHFRRGDAAPDGRFHRFDGTMQRPPQGTRMPRFPGGDHGRGRPQRP